MIYSFDIFDTLITRRVATPRGVFLYLQRQLQADNQGFPISLCENFVYERVQAENNARILARENARDEMTYIPEEIDIEDIYLYLAKRHALEDGCVSRLIEMEIRTEENFLYGIPETLSLFRDLARQNKRIVFISDMYLRRHDIKRLLDNIDPFLLDYAPLYLSSEIKLNKASGRLYAYVAAKEQIDTTSIHHIGDNQYSDIYRAQRCGYKATLFDGSHLTPDELLEKNEDDFGWQISAGLFRECRLKLDSNRSQVGGIYAATVLLPFVLWVVGQARESGYNRVYFFARDGQVLIDIARKLHLNDLELRYLYVSRLACHRCVNQDFDNFLDWVFISHRDMTVYDIVYRITSSPDTVLNYLQKHFGINFSKDKSLNEKQKNDLRTLFKADSQLKKLILDLSSLEREKILKYLNKENVLNGERLCVVDIGWNGSIQDSLYEILRSVAVNPPISLTGFYWGLQRYTNNISESNQKFSFVFHPNTFWRDPSSLREILECFTAADHGSTIGYAEAGDDCVPILNEDGPEIVAWGLAEFRSGIDYFVDKILRLLPQEEIVSLMPYYFRRLKFIVQNPNGLFAREISCFPYCPDPTGKLAPFAPEITALDALKYQLSFGKKRGMITRWQQGSLVNSTPLVKIIMSSNLSIFFVILKILHPRGIIRLLPYSLIQKVKKILPASIVRACRVILT